MNNSAETSCVKAKKIRKASRKKPCRFCNKEFSGTYLPKHEQTHTGEKPFPCDLCSKRFSRTSDLVCHKMIHTGEKPYKCEECTKCFRSSSRLVVHKRLHSGEKPFGCSSCGKFFRTCSKLTVHKKFHSAERPYQCTECPKTFATSYALTSHKKIHYQKCFSCEICNKAFRFARELKIHERHHTGEQPYQCHHCPKFFDYAHALVIHERSHTGEKPFECDKCDKSFPSPYQLKRHHKLHEGTSPKMHRCPICEKQYSKEYLYKHLKRHKEKGPYECDQNVDSASSLIESECIGENLSFEDVLIKKESESEPLSETLVHIKCEADAWVSEMKHDLSFGQYPECENTSLSQDFGVGSLTVNRHPAEEECSLPFEFVSSAFVEQSVDEAVDTRPGTLDIKIEKEDIC